MFQICEPLLSRTLKIAEDSVESGNHPFGALIALNGEIVLEAENRVITDQDATAHAELRALRAMVPTLTAMGISHRKSELTLYASTEPCVMCLGALYWAGIKHVVFACSQKRMTAYTTGSFVVPADQITSHMRNPPQIEGPFLEEQAAQLHAKYWNRRSP